VRPPRIVWGMTAYGPFPYAPVYTSHMLAISYASRYYATGFLDGSAGMLSVYSTDRMYTHSAENLLVERFLKETDGTHLFLTEMDMVLPLDTIPKLARLEKPIASGLYFLRNGEGQACLYVPAPVTPALSKYPHTPVGIFPQDTPFRLGKKGGCCGLGCVLISREVLEAIPYPWFDLKEKNPQTGEGYGSDMYFYTKVREAGFEVWIDPTVRCGHMDYTTVDFDDHLKLLREKPEDLTKRFIIATPDIDEVPA
jgi:hypothetical protein